MLIIKQMFLSGGRQPRQLMLKSMRLRRGFSLIELITVVGIISILIALLLPSLVSARRAAQTIQCASNLRQITMALISYANEFGGTFPPNSAEIEQYWFQHDKIGKYIKTGIKLPDDSIAGGVMVCPNDEDGALRSYAMNTFASGYVSSFVRVAVEAEPPTKGKMFKLGAGESSKLILAVEAQLEYPWPNDGTEPKGWIAAPLIGFSGTPGRRFGADGGVAFTSQRGRMHESQINFQNHRTIQRVPLTRKGRANFGFLSGHVQSYTPDDLADFNTGQSRYEALWSVIDRNFE